MTHKETFKHLSDPVLEMLACLSPKEPTPRDLIAADLNIHASDLTTLISRAKKRGYRIYGCNYASPRNRQHPNQMERCIHMMPGEFFRILAECEKYIEREGWEDGTAGADKRKIRPAEGKESKPRRARRG